MPLSCLVFHFLHPCLEDVSAGVAPSRELSVIAGATVYPVSFGAELLVNQAGPALAALEAALVPVLLLVGKILQQSCQGRFKVAWSPYLAVNSNDFPAFVAVVGEDALVAANAVGMILSEDIPVASQTVVTVVTEQDLVLQLPVLAVRHAVLGAIKGYK